MAFDSTRTTSSGLTIAADNVGLRYGGQCVLKLCEVVGRDDVPVFAGAAEPLLHAAPDAAYVHGQDGFGDTGYAPAARQADAEHAALAILRLSHAHAGKLLLVALGPLTNVALALKLDPTLPQRVARFVVMGGAVTAHGNITPAAEFNVYFDPEAAKIVFDAFPRFELADWEATIAHGSACLGRGWLARARPGRGSTTTFQRQTRTGLANRRGDHWVAAGAGDGLGAGAGRGAGNGRPPGGGTWARPGGAPRWWTGTGRRAARTTPDPLRYDQRRFEGLVERAGGRGG